MTMRKDLVDNNLNTFNTGAMRTKDADNERYDLISPHGLQRLARIYAEGAKKYAPRNWEKGMPISDTLNHLKRHLTLWELGDTSEDHLAKVSWGLFAIMHYEATKPDCMDLPAREVKQNGASRT